MAPVARGGHMLPIRIVDIWRDLPIRRYEFELIVNDAATIAKDPEAAIAHCPWGTSVDPLTRARRTAWRVAFRIMRETAAGSLSALCQRPGELLATQYNPASIPSEVGIPSTYNLLKSHAVKQSFDQPA